MKKLLTLPTKSVYFSFNNKIYIQIDGVSIGSLFRAVIGNIFMVELETTLVLKFEDHIKKWRRFVNDKFIYVKNGSLEYVLPFHKNIKLIYEHEQNNAF